MSSMPPPPFGSPSSAKPATATGGHSRFNDGHEPEQSQHQLENITRPQHSNQSFRFEGARTPNSRQASGQTPPPESPETWFIQEQDRLRREYERRVHENKREAIRTLSYESHDHEDSPAEEDGNHRTGHVSVHQRLGPRTKSKSTNGGRGGDRSGGRGNTRDPTYSQGHATYSNRKNSGYEDSYHGDSGNYSDEEAHSNHKGWHNPTYQIQDDFIRATTSDTVFRL